MVPASDATARIIADNWRRVQDEVVSACGAASRAASEVRIVGVSKYVPPELAWQLASSGCGILGENRPQSLWDKFEYFSQTMSGNPAGRLAGPTQWHLIGHWQRNKVRRTLPMLAALHSLDSLKLAQAVSEEAQSQNLQLPVLVEVNISGDASKTGLSAEALKAFFDRAVGLSGLQICGLMAMSSLTAEPLAARREFEAVRQLRDKFQENYQGQVQLDELSMGMSGDFAEAIAAGATLVRIGTRLWRGIL